MGRIHNNSRTPGSRRNVYIAVFAGVFLLGAGAAAIWLRSDGLLSLDVKDADVNEVLSILAKKSGQTILSTPGLSGKVTTQFRKKPLWEALDIVTGQTSSTWREYYAVGPTKESIEAYRQGLITGGQTEGWSGSRGFRGPGFMAGDETRNQPLRYDATNKPAKDVAMALSFRTQAQVVVADELSARELSVYWIGMTAPLQAAEELAHKIGGRADHFFVVRSFRREQTAEGPPPEVRERMGPMFGGDATTGRGEWRRSGGGGGRQRTEGQLSAGAQVSGGEQSQERPQERPQLTEEEREKRRQEREQSRQAMMEAMTPEQRQQMESMRGQMEQFQQRAGSMTPQQRMQAFQQFVASNPQIQERGTARLISRLKNTTPEQRVEGYRRLAERLKQFEEAQRRGETPPMMRGGGPR